MRWISALLLLILGAGIYLAVRFVQQAPRSVIVSTGNTPALPPNITFRLSGISLVGRKEGAKSWTMHADRMDTTRDHNEIDISGNIHAELLQKGQTQAIIQAQNAHYSNAVKRLNVSGKVLCRLIPTDTRNRDELRIETEAVTWNIGDRQIVCPGRIRATQGDFTAEGEQVNFDLKTRNFSGRNIAASLPVNEEGTLPSLPSLPAPGKITP